MFVTLFIASIIDHKKMEVPNWVLLCGLTEVLLLKGITPFRLLDSAIVLIVLLVYATITNAMGGGDVKLMAILTLGYGAILAMLSLIVGLVLLLIFDKLKKPENRKKTYPLIPFLAAGFLVSQIAGL